MKKLFILLAIFLFQASCVKEKAYTLRFKVINNSNVDISIAPIIFKDTMFVKAGTELARGIYFGSSINRKSPSIQDSIPYYATDKVEVLFDNQYKVTHYKDSIVHSGKYFNKSSSKCLYNKSAYYYTIENSVGGYMKYIILTITPEDYNFAKN